MSKNRNQQKPELPEDMDPVAEEPDAPPEETGAETEEMASDETGHEATPEEREPLEHQLLRMRADFDNFRKRTQREKAAWTQQAVENLVNDLLPVLDHFDLGIQNARQHDAKPAVLEGFEMVEEQFKGALRKYDLEVIQAEHTPFNPEQHEALSFLPSDEVEANTVLTQVRCGYRLGQRLLRPAQVVVSSGPANAEEAPANDTQKPRSAKDDAHVDEA